MMSRPQMGTHADGISGLATRPGSASAPPNDAQAPGSSSQALYAAPLDVPLDVPAAAALPPALSGPVHIVIGGALLSAPLAAQHPGQLVIRLNRFRCTQTTRHSEKDDQAAAARRARRAAAQRGLANSARATHTLRQPFWNWCSPEEASDSSMLHPSGGSSGAHTDRGPAHGRIRAASHQHPAGAPHTHRQVGAGKTSAARELRSRSDAGLSQQYRAPGSPRGRLEHMYIRSNQQGLRDVRLMARAEVESFPSCKTPRQLVTASLPWDCPSAVCSPMAYLRMAGALPPLGASKLGQHGGASRRKVKNMSSGHVAGLGSGGYAPGLTALTKTREPAATLARNNEKLVAIPGDLLHQGLTEVSLVSCCLEVLPSDFGDCAPNITKLILEHNQLASLPASLVKMSHLQHLGLTANRFEAFPDVLAACTTLQVLSIQNNKITSIKATIGYCRELRALYLTSNPMEALPLSIGALPVLSDLSFDVADCMTVPPAEVGAAGHQAVIEWMRVYYHNIVVNFLTMLRSYFLNPQAAFNFFDVEGGRDRRGLQRADGHLDKHELARALEFMQINMRFFDYLWITLDVDNNGFIEYWEFVKNWNSSKGLRLKDPYVALKPLLGTDVISKTADLLWANPWTTSSSESLPSAALID